MQSGLRFFSNDAFKSRLQAVFHGWSGRAEHFVAADVGEAAEKQLEEMSSVRELQGKMQRAVLFYVQKQSYGGRSVQRQVFPAFLGRGEIDGQAMVLPKRRPLMF